MSRAEAGLTSTIGAGSALFDSAAYPDSRDRPKADALVGLEFSEVGTGFRPWPTAAAVDDGGRMGVGCDDVGGDELGGFPHTHPCGEPALGRYGLPVTDAGSRSNRLRVKIRVR